jgi:hypothetical protein
MFTLITQGSFLSAGVPVNIPLPSSADYFKTINMTQLATTQTTGRGFMFEWYGNPSFANNSAIEWFKTNSSNAVNMNLVTTGGFTYVSSFPQPEAPFVGTAITNANPAVASGFTGLPYNNGDRVVLYNTTGMEIIGGMSFTVSSVSSTGFTLLGLNASGFAAPATAVTARRISPVNAVLPEFAYVTGITQAAQGVVSLSIDPVLAGFYVGQKVVFQIPTSFGMVQLNTNNLPGTQDLPAVVTAVNNSGSYTITINVNTTNFTPFAFPASTLSPTAPLFATVAPAGSSTQYNPVLQTFTGYDFNHAPFRSGLFIPYMNLQAGAQSPAGSSGDTIVWQAYKMESTQYGGV